MPQGECPIFILSWKLSAPEQKYAVIEKKARVLQWAIEEFLYYLRGQRFEVVTNHAPLKWLLTFTLCGGIWHCNLIPSCTRRVVAMLMLPFPILGAESQTAGGGGRYVMPQSPWFWSQASPWVISPLPPPKQRRKGQTTQMEEKGNLLDDGELLGQLFIRFGGIPLFTRPHQGRRPNYATSNCFYNKEDTQGTKGVGCGGKAGCYAYLKPSDLKQVCGGCCCWVPIKVLE